MQGKEDEFESNVKRMESSLEFSRAANRNLKSDYDIMTDKFDKQSKAQNNLNQDLKDEITELNNKVSKLQIFYDDSEEIMNTQKAKTKKLIDETTAESTKQIEDMQKERDDCKKELESFKAEFNMKMTQIKIMEMELEEKLQNAEDGD